MKKVLFFLSIIVMMFLVFGCASRDNLNFDAQNTNTQVINDLETSETSTDTQVINDLETSETSTNTQVINDLDASETSTNIQVIDDSSSSNSKFSIPNIQAEYDTSAYNIPMSEALEASKEILDRSVKSNNFVSLSEEDKWQGWIGDNWNVPSYIYGTTSNCDDNLVINGEDLGTLQNLVYQKGNWNNYAKAIFEYNGDIYYVLGLSLATQDDLDCVFLSRDKKDNKDFSEFKFWEWEKGLDGNFHRSGNLGIACTFRNVKMQDGSYATVTIGGYNYSNFGQRVWIKPSTGNDVKVDYPEKNESNTSEEFVFETKIDMDKYFTEKDEANFIFEYTNKTGKDVTIYNFISGYMNIFTKTNKVTVKDGATVYFYYNVDEMIENFDGNFLFYNSTSGKPDFWYYRIGKEMKNQHVKVIMTNDPENGGEKHEYIQIEE